PGLRGRGRERRVPDHAALADVSPGGPRDAMRLPTRRAARPLRAGLLLGAVLLAATGVRAEELRGRVELVARGGAPARGIDVRQAVVYFEPATPVPLRAPE